MNTMTESKKIAGKLFHNIYRQDKNTLDAWHRAHHFVIERVEKGRYDIEVIDPKGLRIVNTVRQVPSMEAATKWALAEAKL